MTPPPTQSHELPSLNGIRAVCIAWVVGAHASQSAAFPAEWATLWRYIFSGVGVLVFFVLSGFLITLLLVREERTTGSIGLRSFYARRFIRILPVYLVFAVVLVLVDVFTRVDIEPCGYLTTLTYTKNYGCGQWVDGHLWSLSVEEQFYLIWPAIIVFSVKWRWRAALMMIATAPIFRVLFYVMGQSGLRNYSFVTNMDALIFGCIAGALLGYREPWMSRVLAWRPSQMRALAASLFYAFWVVQMRLAFGVVTVPLATTVQAASAAYLIASYATVPGGVVHAFLNQRQVRYLGVLSYSIYIWQQLFFVPSGFYSMHQPFFLRFPYNVGAALITAMASYHLLEKPLIEFRGRFRPLIEGTRLVPETKD